MEMMNKKAQKLGMNGTHFCDTTGLHDPDHYSTVRDIAVLLRYALRNDTFREIIESPRHSTGVTNIHPSGITYYSTMFKNLSDTSVLGARSWEARRDIPGRQACAWPALRKFMTGNIFWYLPALRGIREARCMCRMR